MNSSALPCVEGDFCEDGINAVLNAVKDDTRSIAMFGRPIICLCTRASHTARCIASYHQRQVRVAPEQAAAFFEIELHRLRRRPNLVREVRDLLTLGGPPAFLIVTSTVFSKAVSSITERWATHTLGAHELLIIASSLSKTTMLSAGARCVGNDAAATACREYTSWLNGNNLKLCYHQHSPLHAVANMAAHVLQCKVPAEIVHAILAQVIPVTIFEAWQCRQKHEIRCI